MTALERLHECCMVYVLGRNRSTIQCVFCLKCLQVAKKGTSSVRLGSFHARIVPPMRLPTSGCSCARSSMRFLKLSLRIALEWLRECCMGFLGQEAGARNLPSFRVKSLHPAKKGASSVLRLGSFIVPPMCFSTSGSSCVRSSVRFLNLWLHDSIGMAA